MTGEEVIERSHTEEVGERNGLRQRQSPGYAGAFVVGGKVGPRPISFWFPPLPRLDGEGILQTLHVFL
jgi:hypothetical protein